ncbi:hypothetical protein RRG08_055641 [Elysia crispata]|uniref:Uncharacterized protein n=1 Tax=Elysia crispata TaxID=231223 RepID=A0AAE1DBK2_9GAST|nr:hypothetical protein RRG08_055641 [Elysia crispata]
MFSSGTKIWKANTSLGHPRHKNVAFKDDIWEKVCTVTSDQMLLDAVMQNGCLEMWVRPPAVYSERCVLQNLVQSGITDGGLDKLLGAVLSATGRSHAKRMS